MTTTTIPLTAEGRAVVGANWVANPGPWWVPPGLEKTQGPNANPPTYRNVFFGGTRDYKDDEDGMQIYHTPGYRKALRRAKRNRGRNQDYSVYEEDDSYNFDDGQA